MKLEMDSMNKLYSATVTIEIDDITNMACIICPCRTNWCEESHCSASSNPEDESEYRLIGFDETRPEWCPLHTAESCDADAVTAD